MLTNGQLAADGEPAAVIASQVVQEAYLGVTPGAGEHERRAASITPLGCRVVAGQTCITRQGLDCF